ncbi:hypothetical protein TNCV_2065661 [Trichonephila clavipes]|nr:hypothetical protein TNCV_2065661 [Trichonephila clavipes]
MNIIINVLRKFCPTGGNCSSIVLVNIRIKRKVKDDWIMVGCEFRNRENCVWVLKVINECEIQCISRVVPEPGRDVGECNFYIKCVSKILKLISLYGIIGAVPGVVCGIKVAKDHTTTVDLN